MWLCSPEGLFWGVRVGGLSTVKLSAFLGLDCFYQYAMLEYMAKDIKNKPLTIKDIHEVLIPAIWLPPKSRPKIGKTKVDH